MRDIPAELHAPSTRRLPSITSSWGPTTDVTLYLDRCQVDTPQAVVASTWRHVMNLRDTTNFNVVDFGAGDGRFAQHGIYASYTGYEVDRSKYSGVTLPANARLVNDCAFTARAEGFDLCIGNPPYVRNQDLPRGWRQLAAKVIERRTGVQISGLANAWQYFVLLALASTKSDGICALVIPYEWVSRPSALQLRQFIVDNGWSVSAHRLTDSTFGSVLTTASITVIDKGDGEGSWSYFEDSAGDAVKLAGPTASADGVIAYRRRADIKVGDAHARRGLSPGTQKILTLTEGERVRHGLRIGSDVVPCVTSLRPVPFTSSDLTLVRFDKFYRNSGRRCWLIRTDRSPSSRLRVYLDSIPTEDYQTATCLSREEWWRFDMPQVPTALVASSFTSEPPKCVRNVHGVRAVGGVHGVYGASAAQIRTLRDALQEPNLTDRIVGHANGMWKLEIGQLNTILAQCRPASPRTKKSS